MSMSWEGCSFTIVSAPERAEFGNAVMHNNLLVELTSPLAGFETRLPNRSEPKGAVADRSTGAVMPWC